MSWFTQARLRIVPTTWKSVSKDGPAVTTQKRTVSPGSAVSGCFTYCPAYPFQVTQSGVIWWALTMSRAPGSSRPGPFRYPSLATSTYWWSAGGKAAFGSTTIAPYMPLAMCASTGFVPQWYMKTPGSLTLKLKVNDLPGAMSTNAGFGATRAAWKSTECGIGALFVNVTRTVWPCRAWITGP